MGAGTPPSGMDVDVAKARAQARAHARALRKEVVDKMAALATAAFGLVAALAWNSAIQAIFKHYFGDAGNIPGLLTYALVVTLVAVLVTIWIGRAAGELGGDETGD